MIKLILTDSFQLCGVGGGAEEMASDNTGVFSYYIHPVAKDSEAVRHKNNITSTAISSVISF